MRSDRLKTMPARPQRPPKTSAAGRAGTPGTDMWFTANTGISFVSTRPTTSAVTQDKKAATKTTGVKLAASSSRTKTIPARGALNAAASPAPDPAAMSALRSPSPGLMRNHSETIRPVAPPICMVGPSRPRARPPPIPITPAMNFTGSSRFHCSSACPRMNAFNCGIPLPEASGENRFTSHNATAPHEAPIAIATGKRIEPLRPDRKATRWFSTVCSTIRKAEARSPATSPTTRAFGRMCLRFTSGAAKPNDRCGSMLAGSCCASHATQDPTPGAFHAAKGNRERPGL